VTAPFPPGPAGPALWHTLRYLMQPHALFEECHRKHGDVFSLKLLGTGRWVFLCTPALVRQLFTAPAESYDAGAMNGSMWGAIAGQGTLFTLDRDAHLQRRRLLMPPFHGERLRSYVEDMRQVAEEVVASWPREAAPLAEQMQAITLRVLLRVGFGLREKTELRDRTELRERTQHSELMRALVRVADGPLASPLLLMRPLQFDWGRWSPWGRLLAKIRHMDRLLLEEVRRRRDSGERGRDVVSFLLDAREESGRELSEREIRDELVTMLMAGHDTTEISLTWAFAFILSNPRTLRAIREELREVLGGRPIDVEALPRLRYLDAVIQESTRLGPVGPHLSFRRLTVPMAIGGYELPPGTIVSNAVHVLHRRPDLYPEPANFRPERFLDAGAETHEWAPFGGGPRRCIGMTFALWEMKIVLATVLWHLDLALVDREVGWMRSGFFVVPRGGLRVRAAARDRIPAVRTLAAAGAARP
jgi:cytochrome P450 family 110